MPEELERTIKYCGDLGLPFVIKFPFFSLEIFNVCPDSHVCQKEIIEYRLPFNFPNLRCTKPYISLRKKVLCVVLKWFQKLTS